MDGSSPTCVLSHPYKYGYDCVCFTTDSHVYFVIRSMGVYVVRQGQVVGVAIQSLLPYYTLTRLWLQP